MREEWNPSYYYQWNLMSLIKNYLHEMEDNSLMESYLDYLNDNREWIQGMETFRKNLYEEIKNLPEDEERDDYE